ncbi:hypothetical protein IGI04_030448 [Brassica rapa subsp. trilocularis]|uniref:Uncharacterized protein n=1 Tax=Brassica rapa subsp. trilocularis TaxID=1813537 RepID=A0ABQ7LQR0_BRACM|nr:hypothetical protein IGI04_030448 [Brassica rapa subsp. trilocularis]
MGRSMDSINSCEATWDQYSVVHPRLKMKLGESSFTGRYTTYPKFGCKSINPLKMIRFVGVIQRVVIILQNRDIGWIGIF